MARFKCPICNCGFGTEADLQYHLEAHEKFNDDLPSMKNIVKTKITVESEIKKYREYLDNYGKGYQNKIKNFDELSYVFSYDDPEWKKLSEDMKAKANYQCQICGANHVETHHRIPVKHDPSKAFDPDNLLVVCKNCHDAIHNNAKAVLANYTRDLNWVEVPKRKVDSMPSERYCKRCGKFMYSRYETCYDCFKNYY